MVFVGMRMNAYLPPPIREKIEGGIDRLILMPSIQK
jgi:hypothetical protein